MGKWFTKANRGMAIPCSLISAASCHYKILCFIYVHCGINLKERKSAYPNSGPNMAN
jgi:hypothetical protein